MLFGDCVYVRRVSRIKWECTRSACDLQNASRPRARIARHAQFDLHCPVPPAIVSCTIPRTVAIRRMYAAACTSPMHISRACTVAYRISRIPCVRQSLASAMAGIAENDMNDGGGVAALAAAAANLGAEMSARAAHKKSVLIEKTKERRDIAKEIRNDDKKRARLLKRVGGLGEADWLLLVGERAAYIAAKG